MSDHLSVSDAARDISERYEQQVLPRHISRLFYERILRDDLAPIIGGRRLISRTYLPLIEQALRRHGYLKSKPGGAK
jgi:hypothetical protein